MITTVRVGGVFPDIPHNSDVLPLGSVICYDRHSSERYIQEAPRTWVVEGSRPNKHMINTSYLSMPLLLTELAGVDEVTLPPESERQFLWRLRDTALATCERNANNIRAVRAMVADFGATEPLFTVGGVVSNSVDRAALPIGTVLYAGHPSVPNLLNVWTKNGLDLQHTFGPLPGIAAGQPLTIYSMPGEVAVNDDKPASPEALDRLALRAWRIIRAHKSRNSWCGVVEQALHSLGITQTMMASVSSYGPGDVLDRDQVARLPEGSLLWWQWRSGEGFAVYQRDDSARNRAKTRRVAGYADGEENSHERMTVVQIPGDPMIWTLTGQFLRHMPNGVRFISEGNEFVLDDETRSRLSAWSTYSVREFAL